MPQPTREQFDLIAQKVLANAPPGLSREQFMDLIDKEVQRLPPENATPIGNVKDGAQPTTALDPSSGGFFKNVVGDTIDVAGGMIEGAGHVLAHPIDSMTAIPVGMMHRVGEIASDMHPVEAFNRLKQGDVAGAAGQLLPVGEAYHKPVSMAADVMGAEGAVKGLKALTEAPGAMRAANLERKVATGPAQFRGKNAPPSRRTPGGFGAAADAHGTGVERYMPNKSSGDASPVIDPELSEAFGREFSPVGGEGKLQTKGPLAAAGKDPEQMVYEQLMSEGKMGGTQGKGSSTAPPPPDPASTSTRSQWPPDGPEDWHAFPDEASRKAAPKSERDSASSLHRSEADANSRYDYLTDPDNSSSAFTGVEALGAQLLRQMVGEGMRGFRKSTQGRDLISKTATGAKQLGRAGAKTAVVGRFAEEK